MARFLNLLFCHIFGHQWHYWEAGHVYAGDDWNGATLDDGTPWQEAFYSPCDRCGAPKP